MPFKHFFFALIICFFFTAARATHIVGGELNYTYLGGDNYRIRLSVIRDCYNSTTPFDQRASIGVFNSLNAYLFQVLVYPRDSSILPNTANSPCLISPNNICYTVAHYDTVISLPQLSGGYQLAYQRCCRNHSIANIANVASVGATYYASIPDRSLAPANSNPVFDNLPSTFICRNEPLILNNEATDPDGDSLVYQLCVPFNGGSQSIPVPQPPASPPYNNIVWQSPYSFVNPLGGIALSINSSTGVLTAVPSYIGQFVYGVSVKEYRNGIYLGETRRDFQVNVVNCPRIVTSSMQVPDYQCGNNLVSFQNQSAGALTYKWDFGVTTMAEDTSAIAAPQFLYPDTGQYSVTLVAVSSFNSSCRDTSYHVVNLYPALVTDFNHVITDCNDTVAFENNSSLNNDPVVSWDWNFGDGTSSHMPSVNHAYATGGNYAVRLATVSQRGCTDTVSRSIDVPLIPQAAFAAITDSCYPGVAFVNRSLLASTFQWNLGDSTLATSAFLTHIYGKEGEYEVTLISRSESNCFDTASQSVNYQQFEYLGHYIPNSFTPNGDGRNDVFYISGASICEVAEMIIYDRWGKIVYRTEDLSSFWDGTSQGQHVAPGVYIYFLKGMDYTRKGTITVIR